ncbi:MAG: single-stranded DNA-binding protein [Acidobacteria bacterium]|nr:single-stranded DNA-binding protein [Acidobacteriota bacterium]
MANTLVEISRELSAEVDRLSFSLPVTHVYNPLAYAVRPHEAYLERFGQGRKRVVFLGMNPGPFGMAQTGIPFGDVRTVGEWMGIMEPVGSPRDLHPRRPVQGLECPRVEVSGRRLWGWVKDRWHTPNAFFAEAFVANYCPLVFLEDSGRNRTPDRLPLEEKAPLFEICDLALMRMVECLNPDWLVGVGAFASLRATEVLSGMDARIGKILHPSPASPAANRGWWQIAEKQLGEQGIFKWENQS